MNEAFYDRFHVILVEPENNLNIGAVARAMMNLGFPHLHLVAPQEYDRSEARVTACWAESLLDTLVIHATLPDALAEMEDAIALSGEAGNHPSRFLTLPQWSAGLPQGIPCRTALVFGSESNGLRLEHLNYCRRIVRIPASREVPQGYSVIVSPKSFSAFLGLAAKYRRAEATFS